MVALMPGGKRERGARFITRLCPLSLAGARGLIVLWVIALGLLVYANLLLLGSYGYDILHVVTLNLLIVIWILIWLAVYHEVEKEDLCLNQ